VTSAGLYLGEERDACAWTGRFEPPVIASASVDANARAVCSYAGTDPAPSLRHAFLAAVQKLQGTRFPVGDGRNVFMAFDLEEGAEQRSLEHLMQRGPLPPTWRYDDRAEREEIAMKAILGIDLLAWVDPTMRFGIHTLVGALLFGRAGRPGGGGISDTIGAIWLSPSPDWTPLHYAELVLHEHVHQCLFLEDMVHQIFAATLAGLARSDSLVTSAVLRRKRHYDKAFHSAFVAFAIAQLYAALGMRAHSRAHHAPLASTVRELRTKPHLLTAHGRSLLDDLAWRVDRFCSLF
jgi:hypothetical protein